MNPRRRRHQREVRASLRATEREANELNACSKHGVHRVIATDAPYTHVDGTRRHHAIELAWKDTGPMPAYIAFSPIGSGGYERAGVFGDGSIPAPPSNAVKVRVL